MERYRKGKTEALGKNPVPAPPCLPQISQPLTWDRTPGLHGGTPAINRLSHGAAGTHRAGDGMVPTVRLDAF